MTSTSPTPRVTLRAIDIARALGQPDPTDEQVAIIEAPLTPSLVIAGAGSGKTETMASRVVWLVANGWVSVNEILGMTFTRKAAGELSERIQARLELLASSGLMATPPSDLEQATVTTYNSFANRVFAQYAVLLGRNPDATVLGEAGAWQIARTVARESTAPELRVLEKDLASVTQATLDLGRTMRENVANADDILEFARALGSHVSELPMRAGTRKSSDFESTTAANMVGQSLPVLVALAERYAEVKRERGFIEFSDQIALALEIAERFPDVVADLRSQFRVVILDEYQDTSVVQARFLATLFGGTPVMAVGDPHQSIYAWRGASADNMEKFTTAFGVPGIPTATFHLSTSWRNPQRVLDAANALVSPLSAKLTSVSVRELGPKPNVDDGELTCFVRETIDDEAAAVASWLKERVTSATSAAMLVRSLLHIQPFTRALSAAGVRYHVVGLGGLLDQPVVVDLVCALRVLYDATADSELVRLLSGARWAIAPKDLSELKNVALWLAKRDYRHQRLDAEVIASLRESVVVEDSASLVDALDFVATAVEGHTVLSEFSDTGLERLRAAGLEFAALRRRSGVNLAELATLVAQSLNLDIEVVANESAPSAEASLEAFFDLITSYLATDPRAGLGSFLSWLDEAERRERLSAQSVTPEKGVVQIITIHGAKGLEWDVVAIPRMVANELPGDRTRAEHWVKFGRLPYPFRGDREHLPDWNWRAANNQHDLDESYTAFIEAVRTQYDDEQRRLIYVAVTRAKKQLLLSASWWSRQAKPRSPSIYLTELEAAGLLAEPLPEAPASDANPLDGNGELVQWPLNPLEGREQFVRLAAEEVRRADPHMVTPWDDDISLLLAEQERSRSRGTEVAVPSRIPASRFKDYINDPTAVAKAIRRPMPERPYRATALGTIFHSWVEQRSDITTLGDTLDLDFDELDAGADDYIAVDADQLAKLKHTFERSEWGSRRPLEVEIEIHLPLGKVVVICKIDAVYSVPGAPGRVEIVDWKTGKAPRDAADLELKQTQLALYRLAYAQWSGIDVENIDAAFYFVADDMVIRPERLYSETELLERWESAVGSSPR
jgi:DNA helicase-2/ATP-dependent DNA helicase PcrA